MVSWLSSRPRKAYDHFKWPFICYTLQFFSFFPVNNWPHHGMLPKHFRSQFFGMSKLASLSTISEEFIKMICFHLIHYLSHHLSLFHYTTLHTKILQPVRVNRRALNYNYIYFYRWHLYIFPSYSPTRIPIIQRL